MSNAQPAGQDRSKYFAHELGDCEGVIEKEHTLSKCVLTVVSGGKSTIFVRGRPSQAEGEVKEIPIPALVAKVLCSRHNRAQSEFDAEAGRFVAGLEAMNACLGDPTAKFESFDIDGDLIERWMLKTLYGTVSSGDTRMPDGEKTKGLKPPVEGLRILYRGDHFPKGQGLYIRPAPGGSMTDEHELARAPLLSTDGTVIGQHVWVYGFEFVLIAANLAPEAGEVMTEMRYRPKGITVRGGCNKLLRFSWKTGARSDTYLVRWDGKTEFQSSQDAGRG